MQEQLQLTTLRQLTASVTLARNAAGMEFLVVKRQESEAIISLFGAHVLHYAPAGESPWLWLSKDAILDGSRGIRGGIPLCWPWFGPAPARVGAGKPQHGFARSMHWQLDGINDLQESTLLHMSLHASDESRAIWPHNFTLELDICISNELTLLLNSINTDSTSWCYSGALHTYFESVATEQVHIDGIGAIYADKLQQGKQCEEQAFALTGPVDRVYLHPEHQVLLRTGTTDLLLDNHNADSIVVWNPWHQGAAGMVDFDNEGWKTMICVETAITAADGVEVVPDEQHLLGVTIKRNG